MTDTLTRSPRSRAAPASIRRTRAVLTLGAVIGPVYLVVGLAEAVLRDGFDLTRHPLSLLSNGSYGWIHITTLIVTGITTVAVAGAFRQALGRRWVPRLVAVYGAGLVGAGVFRTDPMQQFPIGTPDGPPETITGAGIAHLVFAGLGFAALIAAAMVMAGHFGRTGCPSWRNASRTAGALFLVGFLAVSSGPANPLRLAIFWIGMVAITAWLTALALHVRPGPAAGGS